jgi:hypothetical protein
MKRLRDKENSRQNLLLRRLNVSVFLQQSLKQKKRKDRQKNSSVLRKKM